MIKINGVELQKTYFPDGTLHLKHVAEEGENTKIEWKYENNEELVSLIFITNHLREKINGDIELYMPYVPNARQDRTKNPQDIFMLKYFAGVINSLGFSKVYILDPHSDVTSALIDRVVQMPVEPYIQQAIKLSGISKEKDIVFFPDSGSQKRYSDESKYPYAFGIKQRDWATGEIKGLEVSGDIPKEPFDVLIIDDISSYGGTFYFAAKKLKELGARNIDLYITHCENSILDGKLMDGDLINHIYTTSSLFTKEHDKITIIKL